MSLFTWIMIMIVIYCPWMLSVILVAFVLFMMYAVCPALVWILLGLIVFVGILLIITAIQQDRQEQKKPYKKAIKKRDH